MTPRLWVYPARSAARAVILRRGPSRQVQMIRWDLHDDSFLCGQWFKGRIYDKRCDLSPDGEYLIYFAAKFRKPFHSWTAISRPPYFTALALWPKGDCWNGGGWFESPHSFVLNHGEHESALAEGFVLKKLRCAGLAKWGGEDATVWWQVLEREGWTRVEDCRRKGGIERWVKPRPRGPLSLEMTVAAVGGLERGWYDLRYRVFSAKGDVMPSCPLDWTEWDQGGDLVFARDGKIFRRGFRKGELLPEVELADFNCEKFRELEPPRSVMRW